MDRTITLFNVLTLAIASAALLLSGWNLWLSQFRRGRILLTQPTIFFFGWDDNRGTPTPKVMLRSALFATGSRGQVIENLSVVVRTDDGAFEFPFWGYDDGKGMVRGSGSGIYVGSTGHLAYHHFNPISDDNVFAYTGKTYEIEVHAKPFGRAKGIVLGKYKLDLDDSEAAEALAHCEGGVMWNWSPQERRYYLEYSPRPFEWPALVKKLVGQE